MLDSIGSHYDLLAGGAALMFLLILAAVTVQDTLRRRRSPRDEAQPAQKAAALSEVG